MKESHQAILQRATATGLLNEEDGDEVLLVEDKAKAKPKKSKSKSKSKKEPARRRTRKPNSPKRVVAFGSSSATSLTPKSRLQF